MAWRKCRHVAQLVLDFWQTQQRAASACGVLQCGQCQIGMARW